MFPYFDSDHVFELQLDEICLTNNVGHLLQQFQLNMVYIIFKVVLNMQFTVESDCILVRMPLHFCRVIQLDMSHLSQSIVGKSQTS